MLALAAAFLLSMSVRATHAGMSVVCTSLFEAQHTNNEGSLDDPVSFDQHVADVTDNWRFLLHVCRTVDASPELRKRAVAGCRKFAGNRGRLLADLAHEWGVAEDKLNGLDSGAFTLQLVAFRERKNVEGFLAKLPLGDHTKDYGGAEVPGTRIYRETEKAVRLNYWNDFLSMSDPIYLTTHGDMTRIRYGLYATVADAGVTGESGCGNTR
jgi:hypothetical protein